MSVSRLGCFGTSKDIEAVSHSGFDFIELNLKEIAEMSSGEFDSLAGRLVKNGIGADACSWILPIDLDLTSPKNSPETWVPYLETGAERCRMIGTSVWVVGSGKGRSLKPGNGPAEDQKRRVKNFFMKVGETAEKYGITAALEPLGPANSNYLSTLEECAAFISENQSRLSMICDFRHMTSVNDKPEFIDRYPGLVVHAHIDNPESTERKCPRRNDRYDYSDFIQWISRSGIPRLSVEALDENDLSVLADSAAFLRELCGKYGDVK